MWANWQATCIWEQGIMQFKSVHLDFMLFTAPLVFFSVLLAEVFWTRWTLGVQQKNKKKAAFATFVIILLGGVSFISYHE
jgi:uncharacterized membrane protein YjjP (DUF1212 family)